MMKSRTSLFNKGVSKNLLKNFWPLWVAYFVAALFIIPVSLGETLRYADMYIQQDFLVRFYRVGINLGFLCIVAGPLVAMAMFGYLYNSRSCGMMCSLPVKRETMFLTAYLTGLVPMLISDVLAVVMGWLISIASVQLEFTSVLVTLALVLMINVAFYSFAVFCAMLTGNTVVMPVVYLVINLAVYVAESCIRQLLGWFVFGMSTMDNKFGILSPIAELSSKLSVRNPAYSYGYSAGHVISADSSEIYIQGMDVVIIYFAAGLVLTALALLLYRRRNMETATDVVAITVLKPIFKYCMTFGTAVVFASLVYGNLFQHVMRGINTALMILALMLVGGFIGYFAAEMLIQKTFKVFCCKWKGFIAACCIITAFVFSFEFDLFGFERRVPDARDVQEVSLTSDTFLSQPENIEKVIELHRDIIENKKLHDKSNNSYQVYINYTMKDGSTLERAYHLSTENIYDKNAKNSDLMRLQELGCLQEAIDRRTEMKNPVTAQTVTNFQIYGIRYDEEGQYLDSSVVLTPEQAVEFYEECLLPDIKDGKMGRNIWLYDDSTCDFITNVDIILELSNRSLLADPEDRNSLREDYFSFVLYADAERCVEWIEENTDVEILPICEVTREPQGKG